jgi:hypothetical protein
MIWRRGKKVGSDACEHLQGIAGKGRRAASSPTDAAKNASQKQCCRELAGELPWPRSEPKHAENLGGQAVAPIPIDEPLE